MVRKPVLFYCTLFFCLALSCYSEWQPPPANNCYAIKQSEFAFQAREPVKGELHRVTQPASASCNSVFRDQVDPSALPQPAALHRLASAKKISLRTIGSFQLKDYLSQIYPSHNFW